MQVTPRSTLGPSAPAHGRAHEAIIGVVLCLLGPCELRSQNGSRPLELRPKGLALLAYLTLVEEPQPRTRLADLLFPDAASPRDSLRWYLSYLRRHLPDTLTSDRTGV